MIYNVKDKPPFKELLVFAIQLVMSIFVATVLIANIENVAVSGVLVGVGLSAIVYLFITKFESPMFISSSGAFVAPVITALATGGYTAVLVGGIVSCLIYCIFGLIFKKIPVEKIFKAFPPALIGAVTVVIGVNLMPFVLTYVQINGTTNMWGVSIALITTLSIALISYYSKGIIKILPFLIGILIGYGVATILTLFGGYQIIDFSIFNGVKFFNVPDFAFTHLTSVEFTKLIPVIIIYIAYTISAMMECLSDHAALSGIIGVDLYKNPGLSRIFMGEGVANLISCFVGGLNVCSYGEGVACVGFSKVASTLVTFTAAIMVILLGFFGPIQAFIASIPSCVFAGAAIVLYGFIACSGVKMLQKVNLNDDKNLIIVSSVLTLGISGIVFGGETFSLSATALALVFGIVLNLILKTRNEE